MAGLAACGGGGGAAAPAAEVASIASGTTTVGATPAATARVTLEVLSSSPELTSGLTALVDLTASAGALSVTLNGEDVSAAFATDPRRPGHKIALLTRLRPGSNEVLARQGSAQAKLQLNAYPVTGPIISGPHQTPYACQTHEFKLPDGSTLGPALDADCSAPSRVDYLYLPRGAAELVPMPGAPATGMKLPADAATATTSAGVTVPFVVRLETRVINRGIYQSAVLHDPSREADPTPLAPPSAWNRRLIAIQGLGCAPGWHVQGAVQGSTGIADFDMRLLSPARLAEGYALFANTLQHGANNCNVLLAAETAMMSKEQFIKTNGVPDFTVSAGCSGGSYGSLQPADMIPGLYDGVLTLCTYPDVLTSTINNSDARLLAHYWQGAGSAYSDAQKLAVSGLKAMTALDASLSQAGRADPVTDRADVAGYFSGLWSAAVSLAQRYNPIGNPKGARATLYDAARNVYGIDKSSGFALRPYDNTGLMYGLGALESGAISAEQFVHLNEHIGGVDADANYVARRSAGDLGAITRAYRTGLLLDGGGGLADIPVFDVSGVYADGDNWHFQWYHFALRERLRKAGSLGNFVMWRGDPVPASRAWDLFIEWVRSSRLDSDGGSAHDKVLRNRPAAAVDGCWLSRSQFVAETPTLSSRPDSTCNAALPAWSSPRLVAGAPVAADVLRCTLKPLKAAEFKASFSASQWSRLNAAFPDGVCDWSQPGQGRAPFVAGASVGPSPVRQLFDVLK